MLITNCFSHICKLFFTLIFLLSLNFNSLAVENKDIPKSAKLLSQYLSIESITGNERDAGIFLSEVCESMGLHVEVFTEDVDTFKFAASLYPLDQGKPNIIFLNHIDVVPAEKPEEWTHPPFSGIIDDGYIWGRGAIDMKGMAIMQLMAMKEFIELSKTEDLPYNVTLLAVSGEETGGYTGAKVVTDRFFDRLNPLVVYNEGGTGLPGVLSNDDERKLFGISITTKRTIWLELSLTMETSGHGSVPPPEYSIKNMIDALSKLMWENDNREVRFTETTELMFNELGKLESGLQGMALRNLRLFRPVVRPAIKRDEILYSLVSNTITITGINSEAGVPNKIPANVTAILDCRLLPDVETDDFINQVKRWLDNDDIEINVMQEGIVASPTKIDQYYYKMSDAIKSVYENAEVIPILFPATNDNKYFRAKGIPAYGILPTYMNIELLETIHSIDERLPVKSLLEGIDVYKELLHSFFETN